MGMIRLEGSDFCCFPSISLKLRKRGLVWIGGENNDTHSATSNGAGKSTVFKAIGWAGYGKAVDGKDGDEVIRHGTKCAALQLHLTDGYTVVRERRKQSPKVQLLRDGVPIPGDKAEIQAKIDELLGMDWQTFRNVALYGQRDNRRFIHPDTPDKERKEILQRILRTTIYGHAHKVIKEDLLRLSRSAELIQVEVDKAAARLEEYDLADLKKRRAEWEEKRKQRLEKQSVQVRQFVAEAKRLRKETPDIAALEARLEELQTKQRAAKALAADIEALEAEQETLDQAVKEAYRPYLSAKSKHERAEEAWEKLHPDSDGHCPLCGGSLDEGAAASHIAELKAELEAAEKALKSAQKAHTKAQEALTAKAEELRRAKATLKAERTVLEELPDAQHALAEAKSVKERAAAQRDQGRLALEAAQSIKEEANPLDVQIAQAKERIKLAEATIEKSKGQLKENRREAAHYEFWNKGYSPTGLPSFALDAVMPMLTDSANKYLETLADGDITVNFNTQRELKSAKGEFRDEISLEWEVEGVSGYPPSGGQWKKLEVATNFALMDLVAAQEGADPNVLLLDEVFDGLDAEGVDRVGLLLQKLRAKRETIMVISHASSMQEWFERALIVEKKDGASILTAA